jgi:hypothetical protein
VNPYVNIIQPIAHINGLTFLTNFCELLHILALQIIEQTYFFRPLKRLTKQSKSQDYLPVRSRIPLYISIDYICGALRHILPLKSFHLVVYLFFPQYVALCGLL